MLKWTGQTISCYLQDASNLAWRLQRLVTRLITDVSLILVLLPLFYLHADLFVAYNKVHRRTIRYIDELSEASTNLNFWGHRFRLRRQLTRSEHRKLTFPLQMVKPRNNFLSDVVDAASNDIIKFLFEGVCGTPFVPKRCWNTWLFCFWLCPSYIYPYAINLPTRAYSKTIRCHLIGCSEVFIVLLWSTTMKTPGEKKNIPSSVGGIC